MRFSCAVLAVLAGIALAEPADVACPTVTKTVVNSECEDDCSGGSCAFVSTVNVPCGCPATVPTATLVAPCGGDCPYYGCEAEFRTSLETCPLPTVSSSSSRSWKWTRTRTWTTATPDPEPSTTEEPMETTDEWTGGVITSVATLEMPETTPCPTVTHTTRPSDCEVLQCPVPDCIERTTMTLPCKCEEPETLLYVAGCRTACPDENECATFTRTETATCETMGGW